MSAEQPVTRDRAAFLNAVLEALPEGLLVSDDARIVEANDAICRITGFDRDELVGSELPFPFFPPESSERIERFLREVRDRGSGEAEVELMRKDGSRFTALLSAGTASEGEGATRVVVVRDISRMADRERRLAELAAKDELTGLLNKRSFLVNLAGEVARARRHNRSLALAILDLDGFKRVNDAGGHPAGDRVLAEAAGRLGALVRSGEHLARVGGDEFGWILPDADAEGASSAVNRAREVIAGEEFRGAGALSLSAGICVTDGTVEAGEVYHRADRALYNAKRTGGNDIVVV
jgi:diguanylate cyclase (GGDEF)-like protein/PAS domain S-box-containing protein